jgi:hypothetical protein
MLRLDAIAARLEVLFGAFRAAVSRAEEGASIFATA